MGKKMGKLRGKGSDGAGREALDGLLHRLCGEDDASEIERVLARGADPASRLGGEGRTPLMKAAQWGSASAVRVLLPVSDLHALDDHGRGALEIAAEAGASEVVGLLLEAGGTKLAEAHGAKAMMKAIPSGGVQWALGKEVDENWMGMESTGRWGACVGMLAWACDLEAPDYAGMTAAGLARSRSVPVFMELARKFEEVTATKLRSELGAVAKTPSSNHGRSPAL